MTDAEVKARVDACMRLIPREDEGTWTVEQGPAEDAVAAAAYALRCRQNGKAQEAGWAARRAYEALHYFVKQAEKFDQKGPELVARVMAHPLVQAELERQQRDVEELASGKTDLAQLRQRAKAESEYVFQLRA